MEYLDYNNTEVSYRKERDPRELNVVEMINKCTEIKATLPNVNDDHVCVTELEAKLHAVEKELADLKYANLIERLMTSFSAGGDVTIEGDADFETAVIIDKDVNLDLNGKNLTVKEDTDGSGVFHVTGGTLTIDGKGTINGTGMNDYNMAIWADGGNVVINDGTFTNEGATATFDSDHFDLIYAKNGAAVEINGGFFRCATPKWTLNKNDSTPSTIIVKGGTFVDYDPSNSETENPVANFVADGYKVVAETQDNGEIWYTVVAE